MKKKSTSLNRFPVYYIQHNFMKKILLFVIASFAMISAFAGTYYSQGNLTANTLTNWNSIRTGGGTTPANFTTSGDIFVVQGAIASGGGGAADHTMTITGSSITFGANVKVLIEGGGTLFCTNSFTINATGTLQVDAGGTLNWNNTGGLANPFGGTETFASASNFIVSAGLTTGPSTVTFGGSFGNFTQNGGATMQCNALLPNIAGNLTITSGTVRLCGSVAGNTGVNVSGNLLINGGTLDFGNGSVSGYNFNLGGNFTISSGTLTHAITGGSSGTHVSGNFNFTKAGTQTFTKSGGTFTATASSFRDINFNVLSGSTLDMGTSILDALATTQINFTLNSGAGLMTQNAGGITSANTASGCIQNLTGTRSFSTGGNYTFYGSNASAVTGTGLPATVNNLTINNSNANGVTLTNASVTVSSTLTLSQGPFTTGANVAIIPNGATVSRTTGWVNGNLQKYITTGSPSITFEVGGASVYAPVTTAMNNVTVAGSFIVKNTDGDHPSLGSSTIDASKRVNRYWSITNSGVTYTSYSPTFTFVSGDVQGSANTANFIVGNYNPTTWTYPTVGTKTSTSTQATGLTTGGDFQLGEIVSNSVTTGTIAPTSYCAGASVSVPYTIVGTYTGGNTFTAQLSNSSGSFASPVNIGSLTQTTAGTITATIPSTTVTGSGYLIRVVASNPATTGSSSVALTITLPSITLSNAGVASVCFSAGSQLADLGYSAKSNATNYTITGWSAAAITAGFTDVTSTVIPSSPIQITVPAGTPAATNVYTAILTVDNGTCTNTYNITVNVSVTPTLGVGGVSATTVCNGALSTITLTGLVPSSVGSVINYDINGTASSATVTANGSGVATFTKALVTGNTTLTVNSIVNGCTVSFSESATLTVNALPSVPGAGTGGSTCGTGTVNISVPNPTAPETIDWYAASSGGSVLAGGTGTNTFTTPSISSTTNYFAETRNATTGCVSSSRTSVTATFNTAVSATMGANPTVNQGTTTASLTYSGATGTPDRYSIDYDAAAEAAGFTDVSITAGSSPITLTVPGAAPAAIYNATVTISRNSTGCSATYGFTVTVKVPTTYYSQGNLNAAALASWNSNRLGGGTTPTDFISGDIFVIQGAIASGGGGAANHSMTTGSAWTVSGTGNKIQIEGGGTLTATNLVATSIFQVDNNGTYIHNTTSGGTTGATSDFPGSTTRTLGATSQVTILQWGGTGTPALIPAIPYGNLTFSPTTTWSGSMNMIGTLVSIQGNLVVTATGGGAIELRLTGSQNYTLAIGGSVTVSGGALGFSNGGGNPTVTVGGDFTVSGGLCYFSNSTGSPNFDITGNLSVSSGATLTGSSSANSTIRVRGNVTTAGTLTFASSGGVPSVTIDKSFTATAGTTKLSGTGNGTTSCSFSIGGDFTISGATVSNGTGGTSTVNINGTAAGTTGSFLMSSGSYTNGTSSTAIIVMNIAGDMILTGGTYTLLGGSAGLPTIGATININGTVATTTGKLALSGSAIMTAGTQTTSWAITTYGDVVLTGTSSFLHGSSSSGRNQILTIGGNFNVGSGTTFTMANNNSTASAIKFSGGPSAGVNTVSFTNAGTFTITGVDSTVVETGKTLVLNSDYDMTAASLSAGLFFNVRGTLDLCTNKVLGTFGRFDLASGATLKIGDVNGITSTLATLTGSVRTTTLRTFSTSANYEYCGSTSPAITGTGLPATVNNLTINNTNNVSLTNSVTVNGTLALTSGKLILGANNITIATGSSITGVPALGNTTGNWVVTNSTGYLKRLGLAVSSPVWFPVGPSTSLFNPAEINVSGTSDDFTVNVRNVDVPGITTNFEVKDLWTITEATPGGSNANVTLQWNVSDEQTNFTSTNCSVVRTDAGGVIQTTPSYSNSDASSTHYVTGTFGSGVSDYATNIGVYTEGPLITVTPTSLDFGTVVFGSSSSALTYTVSGINLQGDIVITAPADFQVFNGTSWVTSYNLTPTGGVVSATTVQVRYTPSAAYGTVTPAVSVSNASTLAATKLVSVTGIAIATDPGSTAPTVTCGTTTSYSIALTLAGGSGTNKIVFVSTSPISATPSDGTSYIDGGNVYGVGTPTIAAGVYPVYIGTGTSVTVTGLTPLQTYYFKVFTFNVGTNNSANYYTGAGGTCNSTLPDGTIVATDYFISNGTGGGDWSTSSTWLSSHTSATGPWISATAVPDYTSKTVTIQLTDNVTISTAVTLDELTIGSTATLTLASTGTLTVNDGTGTDITVNGTFDNQINNIAFTAAPGSMTVNGTYKVTGYNGAGQLVLTNVTFTAGSAGGTLYINTTNVPRLPASNPGNVIWNTPTASGTFLNSGTTTIGGDLTIISTLTGGTNGLNNGSGGTGRTLNITGDLKMQGGTYYIAGGALAVTSAQVTTVSGNLVQTGGSLIANSGNFTAPGTGTLNINGNATISGAAVALYAADNNGTVPSVIMGVINIGGNLNQTAGNFGNAAGITSGTINFTGAAAKSAIVNNAITGVPTVNVSGTGLVTLNSDCSTSAILNLTGGDFTIATNKTYTYVPTSGTISNISNSRTLTIDGTFDNGGEGQIKVPGAGAPIPTITVNGTFINRDIDGLIGSGGAMAINNSSTWVTLNLNTGSTVDYALAGNQSVSGTSAPAYYNVKLSNGGTKTLSSTNLATGTITISGTTIFDAQNFSFGASAANLTMTGTSLYKTAGTGTRPTAQGTYALDPTTTIEFTNTAATLQDIYSNTAPNYYANIVVSGTNVGTKNTTDVVKLQSGVTLTVKNGATFKVGSLNGFSGAANTAVSNVNNPSIVLETNSTVYYYGGTFPIPTGATVQTISNQIPYYHLQFIGPAQMTAPAGTITLYGNWSNNSSAFNNNGGTVLFAGSLASQDYSNNIVGNPFYNLTVNNTFTGGYLNMLNDMTVNNTLTLTTGNININNKTLSLNGTIANSGTGTLTGSSSSNLIIGGSSGGNLGTLLFTAGAQSLSTLTTNRTGGGAAATLGTDLRVYNTSTFNTGEFLINGNTLEMNTVIMYPAAGTLTGSATSNLTIDGTATNLRFTNGKTTLKNFLMNSGSNASLGDSLDITAGLAANGAGSVTVAAGGALTTNDKITLKSNLYGTARVGKTFGTITGKATVERYIDLTVFPGSRRWHLLTAPFKNDGTSQTIKQAWQENATPTTATTDATTTASIYNPVPGFGTHITRSTTAGAYGGYDIGSTNNPSIYYTTTGTGGNFTPINRTDTPKIASQEGYMLFVRGDRSIVVAGTGVSPTKTTLRAKGTLAVGDVTKPIVNGKQIIANPYASAIHLDDVELNGQTFSQDVRGIWYWDPKTSGSFDVGKFISISSDGTPFPSYTVGPNTSGLLNDSIPSGAAILVLDSSASPTSIIFHENDKIDTSMNIGIAARPVRGNRPAGLAPGLYKLYTSLFAVHSDNSLSLADGVVNTFYPTYTNEVDYKDILKLSSFNTKEDLSLVRESRQLAVERRKPLTVTDTAFLQIKNLNNANYEFQFNAQNFDPAFIPYLEDAMNHSSTMINTSGSSITSYRFTVNNSNPVSSSVDRFRIVFLSKREAPLPVTITTIKAKEENKNIAVEWKVENELNIQSYEVEKSVNGVNFTKVATVNAGALTYNWLDVNPAAGYNYYRIRSINQNGEISYSQIVKVMIGKTAPSISAYPTIIENGVTGLQLNNMPAGKYDVRLINAAGQIVLIKQINYNGGNSVEEIRVDNSSSKGIYHLEVIGPDNKKTIIKVLNK